MLSAQMLPRVACQLAGRQKRPVQSISFSQKRAQVDLYAVKHAVGVEIKVA